MAHPYFTPCHPTRRLSPSNTAPIFQRAQPYRSPASCAPGTFVDANLFRRVDELFNAVLPLPPEQRAAYLDSHCDDPAVRREVDQLLAYDANARALHTDAMRQAISSSVAALELPLPEQIAGYRIIREIGRGGMGIVYLAEQPNPRRQIALKAIRPGISSVEMLRRFELEAQVLGRLAHPGIAQILEAGAAEIAGVRQPFIAMEFIAGEPLLDYARSRSLDTRERVDLIIRICDAIQHAHQRGVIHRDLKPSNILVMPEETAGSTMSPATGAGRSDSTIGATTLLRTGGQPKILDFGIARLAEDNADLTRYQTNVGQMIGTLAYMSPEQIAGDPLAVDTRTDVYALGVILFQLLTDRLPRFGPGTSHANALRTMHEEPLPRMTSLNPRIPRDLETIARKALETDPARRYSSAAELAADLRRFRSDEPILARPPSIGYQFAKFARRNRALVGGTALALLALVLGAIGTTWQAWRATAEMHRAEAAATQAREQTAVAEAINDFLRELLTASDAEESDTDPDVRVSTVLDRAEAKISAGSLRDHPETEIGVRTTLARMNTQLARFEAAEAHLRRVLELLRERGRMDCREGVATLTDLGTVLLTSQQLNDAEPIVNETVDRARRVFGRNSVEAASALCNLGQYFQYRRRTDEAEPALREAIDILSTAGDDQLQLAAISLNNLANLKRDSGDYAGAEPYYRRAIDMIRRKLGNRSALLALMLNNMGLAIKMQGRLEEAEPLYRESLEIRRAKLPANHPTLAESLNNLGALMRDRHNFAAAEPLFREALQIAEQSFGPTHPNTAFTRRSVGICLSHQDRFADAEQFLLQSYETLYANPAVRNHAIATIPQILYLYENWQKADPAAVSDEKIAEWKAKLPTSQPASAPATRT